MEPGFLWCSFAASDTNRSRVGGFQVTLAVYLLPTSLNVRLLLRPGSRPADRHGRASDEEWCRILNALAVKRQIGEAGDRRSAPGWLSGSGRPGG